MPLGAQAPLHAPPSAPPPKPERFDWGEGQLEADFDTAVEDLGGLDAAKVRLLAIACSVCCASATCRAARHHAAHGLHDRAIYCRLTARLTLASPVAPPAVQPIDILNRTHHPKLTLRIVQR